MVGKVFVLDEPVFRFVVGGEEVERVLERPVLRIALDIDAWQIVTHITGAPVVNGNAKRRAKEVGKTRRFLWPQEFAVCNMDGEAFDGHVVLTAQEFALPMCWLAGVENLANVNQFDEKYAAGLCEQEREGFEGYKLVENVRDAIRAVGAADSFENLGPIQVYVIGGPEILRNGCEAEMLGVERTRFFQTVAIKPIFPLVAVWRHLSQCHSVMTLNAGKGSRWLAVDAAIHCPRQEVLWLRFWNLCRQFRKENGEGSVIPEQIYPLLRCYVVGCKVTARGVNAYEELLEHCQKQHGKLFDKRDLDKMKDKVGKAVKFWV